jgi:hypothetical protein
VPRTSEMNARSSARFLRLAIQSLLALALASPCAFAQIENQSLFKPATRHDVSARLSDLAAVKIEGFVLPERGEHAVRGLPLPPKLQRPGGPSLPIAPSNKVNLPKPAPVSQNVTRLLFIEGIVDDAKHKFVPPDANGAVGTTQFVEWANTTLMVFDKKGSPLLGPIDGNRLWLNFGGKCEASNDGDPIVLFDKIANRWVMTQFAYSGEPSNSYSQCIAVSKTEDARGAYNRYEFQFDQFNDYPKFGVWPDAYYASFNMFSGPGLTDSFTGAMVCAFERSKMLTGDQANMRCFYFPASTNLFGFLPADLDGRTLPPSNSPNYFVTYSTFDSISLWKFHVDWSNSSNSRFDGPDKISVADFDVPCAQDTYNNEIPCIRQPKAGAVDQALQSLADRLMYRLAYRNLADHESLVVNHTVKVGEASGVRWYEFQQTAQSPFRLGQQGTIAPDTQFRWMGSIASDSQGDLLAGYSLSGAAKFPSIKYTGRLKSDAPGSMESEGTIIDGKGSQASNEGVNPDFSRWGDYSSMSVDPVDDCTFWFVTEGLKDTGEFVWHTYVAAFRFKTCRAPSAAKPSR